MTFILVDIAQLFYDAVQTGAADHYTQSQRDAWSGPAPDPSRWHTRLTTQHSLVAVRNTQLLGLMSLTDQGVIDLAYTSPTATGQGIATTLLSALTTHARTQNHTHLTTEASLTAQPFFLRRGWRIIAHQTAKRHGVSLSNARMEFSL